TKNTKLFMVTLFGGVKQHRQVQKLRRGVDIVVATPGRLLDLMEQGFVNLKHLDYFVLDEADTMMDMGFIHDLRR
ncbi:MAG: DEAD/DEAH box helicase, partial [Flavobacteriales bacterium]